MSSSRMAREDLAAFINEQAETGEMEVDPYGYAVTVIATVLEYSLDDGISGSMNSREFNILDHLARTLVVLDPAIEIEPRVG